MAKKIEVRWEVEDGYVGGDRPQSTDVYVDAFIGDDADEWEDEAYDIVRDDFEQKITYHIINMPEVIAAIQAAQKAEDDT